MRIKQTFAGEYITNVPYQLTLGGKVYEGKVDNSGKIQHELPKGAKQGILKKTHWVRKAAFGIG